MNIVQYLSPTKQRQVALVDGDRLHSLQGINSTYQLVKKAIADKSTLPQLIEKLTGDQWVDYQAVIQSRNLLLPIDHPDPYHFWITGTGLTHLGSADARDKMHQTADDRETDSSRMFQLGLSGGKPVDSKIGVQPEWFYKGNALSLVNPGDALLLPSFSDSGSEEVEVCAFHYIGDNGIPFRVGYTLGNEFSDHIMEKKNYLYLAHSKMRPSSFGPELLIDELPNDIQGQVSILRDGQQIWGKPFFTGEKNMCHSLENLEYHHFKYPMFRRPGDLHGHFLGTATLSFSDNIEVKDNDVFRIEAPQFGRPLLNLFKVEDLERPQIDNSLLA